MGVDLLALEWKQPPATDVSRLSAGSLPQISNFVRIEVLEAWRDSIWTDQHVAGDDWLEVYKSKGELGLCKSLGAVHGKFTELSVLHAPHDASI